VLKPNGHIEIWIDSVCFARLNNYSISGKQHFCTVKK